MEKALGPCLTLRATFFASPVVILHWITHRFCNKEPWVQTYCLGDHLCFYALEDTHALLSADIA